MKGTAKLFIDFESKATTWTNLVNELKKEYEKKMNSALSIKNCKKERKKERRHQYNICMKCYRLRTNPILILAQLLLIRYMDCLDQSK